MLLEVGLIHHIVHKACNILDSCCICCRIRTVESEMEVEVRELLLDFSEILEVEGLDEGACTVEEVNRLAGLESLEELHNVAAQRSHTCTASDEDVLLGVRVVLRKEEVTERTAYHNLVARLAGEDV